MSKILKISLLILSVLLILSCSSNEDKLFKAIENGNLSKIQSLIESGVSVTSKDKNGLTPIEIARKNKLKDIESYFYDELKKVFDSETGKLLKLKFSQRLLELKNIETIRKRDYKVYLDNNDNILNSMNSDKRINEQLLLEQEKFFKTHQESIRKFINAKVDLIEDIMKVFIIKDYIDDIESKDCRHIVNVNIMLNLSDI
ncbi:MAG: ankyrin repeat domain-containing protein [Candidatus Delongbacteria bacterium]|jgi:hypothetical protein|nr:ankyrin repeat domain-containing protein [Candidatus Delongbacteria bacterium]